METRTNELLTAGPLATVKEEPMDQTGAKQDAQQSQVQGVCIEEECEQRIECTTEGQEHETRAFLSKCVFCGKTFTCGDDPKLLECLHAACSACVNTKLTDPNTSVDVDVLCKATLYTLIYSSAFFSVFTLQYL